MCGILGIVAQSPVNQTLYDGLQLLQHRGQDSAGIVTAQGNRFHMHKGSGMVRDVFRTRNMRSLAGNIGIGHVRYPTAGSAKNLAEAQPFYVNSPYGLVLAHNGNLTNTETLKDTMLRQDLRHINTHSDSEVLLNVFAHELQDVLRRETLSANAIFQAVQAVSQRIKGAYAVVALIAGFGLVAFRDPNGIRPLVLGSCDNEQGGKDYMIASESVALSCNHFMLDRDVEPGEAIVIEADGTLHTQICAPQGQHAICMFEYVYFARPDSIIDGASVYETRLKMGEKLGDKIRRDHPELNDIDVVIPIPDTSLPSALQLANHLNLPFRLGFIKNRYVGRTFIMPGQAIRKKSVRQKLNAMAHEFKNKNVLLVDDSIVRGTTSREIVQMARDAGAKKVYFASAAPAVRFPNVYGIDMPTRAELLATNRNTEDIAREIGADAVIFQDLDALKAAVSECMPNAPSTFETSCFDGEYVTGDVDEAYLSHIEQVRGEHSQQQKEAQSDGTLDKNMNVAEQNLLS